MYGYDVKRILYHTKQYMTYKVRSIFALLFYLPGKYKTFVVHDTYTYLQEVSKKNFSLQNVEMEALGFNDFMVKIRLKKLSFELPGHQVNFNYK